MVLWPWRWWRPSPCRTPCSSSWPPPSPTWWCGPPPARRSGRTCRISSRGQSLQSWKVDNFAEIQQYSSSSAKRPRFQYKSFDRGGRGLLFWQAEVLGSLKTWARASWAAASASSGNKYFIVRAAVPVLALSLNTRVILIHLHFRKTANTAYLSWGLLFVESCYYGFHT